MRHNFLLALEQSQFNAAPQRQFSYGIVQPSIWGAFILLGAIFNILDWPGLTILLVSTGGMTGYNIIAWLILRGKNIANNMLLGLGITWIAILIAGAIWNDGVPCNEKGLIMHGTSILIVGGINALAHRKYFARTVN